MDSTRRYERLGRPRSVGALFDRIRRRSGVDRRSGREPTCRPVGRLPTRDLALPPALWVHGSLLRAGPVPRPALDRVAAGGDAPSAGKPPHSEQFGSGMSSPPSPCSSRATPTWCSSWPRFSSPPFLLRRAGARVARSVALAAAVAGAFAMWVAVDVGRLVDFASSDRQFAIGWQHAAGLKIPAGVDVDLMFMEGRILLEKVLATLPPTPRTRRASSRAPSRPRPTWADRPRRGSRCWRTRG